MARFTNIYRIIILLISGLVEIPVGSLELFKPQTFNKVLTPELIQLSHAFGIGAFSIGLLSMVLVRTKSVEATKIGLMVLAFYHLGIGITQGVMNNDGPMVPAIAFHGFLVLSMVFVLIQTYRMKD